MMSFNILMKKLSKLNECSPNLGTNNQVVKWQNCHLIGVIYTLAKLVKLEWFWQGGVKYTHFLQYQT
jgi:hypothetical protein